VVGCNCKLQVAILSNRAARLVQVFQDFFTNFYRIVVIWILVSDGGQQGYVLLTFTC